MIVITTVLYAVMYDTPNGTKSYTLDWMDYTTAERALKAFKERYLNEDGTPKAYPNGKGFYAVSNPRIEAVTVGEILQ